MKKRNVILFGLVACVAFSALSSCQGRKNRGYEGPAFLIGHSSQIPIKHAYYQADAETHRFLLSSEAAQDTHINSGSVSPAVWLEVPNDFLNRTVIFNERNEPGQSVYIRIEGDNVHKSGRSNDPQGIGYGTVQVNSYPETPEKFTIQVYLYSLVGGGHEKSLLQCDYTANFEKKEYQQEP